MIKLIDGKKIVVKLVKKITLKQVSALSLIIFFLDKQQHVNIVMSFYYTLCKTDGIVFNVILHESNIKVFVMVILCRGQTTSCDK